MSTNETMNTVNTVNTNNASSTSHTFENPLEGIGSLLKAVALLCPQLTIAQAESVLEDLNDLQFIISDDLSSRIPADRLSMVEGKWYLCAVRTTNSAEEYQANYAKILRASPLSSLEGYAEQLLTAATEKLEQLSYADDFDPEWAKTEYEAEAQYNQALSNALVAIQHLVDEHGGDAISESVGIDSGIIETLCPRIVD